MSGCAGNSRRRLNNPPVAVGTGRCPPHRPVLALLTHTVPTLEISSPIPFRLHGLPQHCIAPVFSGSVSSTGPCLGISLAGRLPSTCSAGSSLPLFARGPEGALFLCMHGAFDSAGPRRTRAGVRRSLPSWQPDAVGSLHRWISELNTQPTDTPVQRFKCSLTAALTWLGARVERYSFPRTTLSFATPCRFIPALSRFANLSAWPCGPPKAMKTSPVHTSPFRM
jgi:hypothetical protein